MHEIFVASDCSENIIRILFVDFRKAFDLIDYNVLFNKLLVVVYPSILLHGHLTFCMDVSSLSKLVTLNLLQLQ